MTNTNRRKKKALKNDTGRASTGGSCFFKAFVIGIVVTVLCLMVMCLGVSSFMVSKDDSTGMMKIISPAITAISLIIGGFTCGKTNKTASMATAFLCGCASLGICYALSTIMDLGGEMEVFNKTVSIAIMLLSPVLGAKISGGGREKNRRRNTKL